MRAVKLSKREKAINAVARHQLRVFRKKFGRDPGPEEPALFDPDNELNQSVISKYQEEIWFEFLRATPLPPHFLHAYKRTGRLITAENVDDVPMEDLKIWDAAIADYFQCDRKAGNGFQVFH